MTCQVRRQIFINESGFYSLILSSKLKTVEIVKKWVISDVLPSIGIYGYYKMFNNPNTLPFKIYTTYILKLFHILKGFIPIY